MKRGIIVAGLLLAAAAAQAQFSYTTNGNTYYYSVTNSQITITNFAGAGGVAVIPSMITGLPVTTLGIAAFSNSYLSSVTIPGTVTNVAAAAFSTCYELTNVSLAASVRSIGDFAFFYCSSLVSVSLPASVTNMGLGPFTACSSLTNISVDSNNPALTSVGGVLFNKNESRLIQYPDGNLAQSYTIPGSVVTIGDDAFADCVNLTNVTVPASVSTISGSAFANSFLTDISLPDTVTTIGDSAFAYSFLGDITLPSHLTSIGNSVFAGTDLVDVTIPVGVTSIGPNAFYSCSSLTNVTIPASVNTIGTNAFGSTSLDTVTIPGAVASLGSYSFSQCGSLTAVYFLGDAPAVDATVFANPFMGQNYYYATAYYLQGTSGWPVFSTDSGLPTATWTLANPVILTGSAGPGVSSNRFGFTVSWEDNQTVIIQVSTNLTPPSWVSVATNTLTNSTWYFADPKWTNSQSRFYRVTTP